MRANQKDRIMQEISRLQIIISNHYERQHELIEAKNENTLEEMAEIQRQLNQHEPQLNDLKQQLQQLQPQNVWQAILTSADQIEATPIEWLWPNWIAKGKFTILAGAGGTGKTTIALNLAAILTAGRRWPDGTPNTQKGNVLIWSSEDDPADTLKPRLMAAGADLKRVHFIEGRINQINGEREAFDPATDFDTLKAAAAQIGGVSLMILDPVVNLVRGDMHKANDVRRGLQGVVDFAELMGCAVLGISHFTKGTGGSSPADRVIGSQAFGALARTVLVAAKQEESETRVLARAKSNISDDQGGFNYTIEQCTVYSNKNLPIVTTQAVWGDFIEGCAREILSDVEEIQDGRVNDDPAIALSRILSDGEMLAREAKKLMKSDGYTDKQIRTAREKLGIKTERAGFGAEMKTFWVMPDKPPLEAVPLVMPPVVPTETMGITANNGHNWEQKGKVMPTKQVMNEVEL